MDLRQLRNFITLAETLNFSRAAEALYISQPTLSQQVAEMERELGVSLFERTRRSVELTDSGKVLLREARGLLQTAEQMAIAVRDTASHAQDQDLSLFIGIDTRADRIGYLRRALSKAVFLCNSEMPAFRVNFATYEHDELVRGLVDGAIDISFFLHFAPDIRSNMPFAIKAIHQEEMVLVIRSEHGYDDTRKNVLDILRTKPVILMEKETKGLYQAMRILDALKVEASIRFATTGRDMVYLVESGCGAGIMPQSAVRDLDDPELQVLHFGVPEAALYMLAVWRKAVSNTLVKTVIAKMEKLF